MCTNTYSNKERFDKVITKIKWCSFFRPTVYLTLDNTGNEIILHGEGFHIWLQQESREKSS